MIRLETLTMSPYINGMTTLELEMLLAAGARDAEAVAEVVVAPMAAWTRVVLLEL